MRSLEESAKLVSGVPGRKKWRDLFDEEFQGRLSEQSQQFATLADSVKTANGAIQLAMQQIAVLNKRQVELNDQLAKLKALPSPEENGETSKGTEVKGE